MVDAEGSGTAGRREGGREGEGEAEGVSLDALFGRGPSARGRVQQVVRSHDGLAGRRRRQHGAAGGQHADGTGHASGERRKKQRWATWLEGRSQHACMWERE